MGLHFSFGLIQQLLVLVLQSTLPVADLTTQLFDLIVQILEGEMIILLQKRPKFESSQLKKVLLSIWTRQLSGSYIQGLVSLLLLLLQVFQFHLQLVLCLLQVGQLLLLPVQGTL